MCHRAEQCCEDLLLMARQARRHRLGPLHPSFDLLQLVRDSLISRLPDDAHCRVSGRLGVSLTRVSTGRNVLVSEFLSREELVEVRSPPADGSLSPFFARHLIEQQVNGQVCVHLSMGAAVLPRRRRALPLAVPEAANWRLLKSHACHCSMSLKCVLVFQLCDLVVH